MGNWLKIRLAEKIIAISDSTVQLMFSLGADTSKVEKISLGIDIGRGQPMAYETATNTSRILSVGHIQRPKRQKDAIRTLARLIPEIPELSLSIAGEIYDPDYYQELKHLVGTLNLEHHVHFLGVRNDVLSLMQNSLALLLCSESEAFSWVTIEAMSTGLPVVASASGGPGEIITDGQTGSLVPVGDIDGYVRALRQIILNPEWAALLAKNAHDLIATNYSAEEMVARYAEMYKNMILNPSGT